MSFVQSPNEENRRLTHDGSDVPNGSHQRPPLDPRVEDFQIREPVTEESDCIVLQQTERATDHRDSLQDKPESRSKPKLAVDDFVARKASKSHAEHQIPSGFPEGAGTHD
jgi:hypothetical protein